MIRPIAITPGEPSGIGPDIVLQWCARGTDRPYFVIANLAMLQQRAHILGVTLELCAIGDRPLTELPFRVGTLWVLDVSLHFTPKAFNINFVDIKSVMKCKEILNLTLFLH